MCVNLHGNEGTFWSLGIIRVHGSLPAERLREFGLDLDGDIIAICTDGASVMVKVGKLIKADQQLCFAHSIQLAVLDVLYKRLPVPTPTSPTGIILHEVSSHEVSSESVVVSTIQEDADPEDLDDNNDDVENTELLLFFEDDETVTELSNEYQQVVTKVRTVVKIFKRSPTKNDAVLQNYVVMEYGRELHLVLDYKTVGVACVQCWKCSTDSEILHKNPVLTSKHKAL